MQNEPLADALADEDLRAARDRQAQAWQKVFDTLEAADVARLIVEARATEREVRSAINEARRRVLDKYGVADKRTLQVGTSRLRKLIGPPTVNAKGISRSALHSLDSVRLE